MRAIPVKARAFGNSPQMTTPHSAKQSKKGATESVRPSR
jgi:hypothetical protein